MSWVCVWHFKWQACILNIYDGHFFCLMDKFLAVLIARIKTKVMSSGTENQRRTGQARSPFSENFMHCILTNSTKMPNLKCECDTCAFCLQLQSVKSEMKNTLIATLKAHNSLQKEIQKVQQDVKSFKVR